MGVQESLLPADTPIEPRSDDDAALLWAAQILTRYAEAEQALGRLTIALQLPIQNGSLGSLAAVKARLTKQTDRSCNQLNTCIDRWAKNRPFRHLLAHGTLKTLYDEDGVPFTITRHLPRDESDITHDKVWSEQECMELLRHVTNDGRSICDRVDNILANPALVSALSS